MESFERDNEFEEDFEENHYFFERGKNRDEKSELAH